MPNITVPANIFQHTLDPVMGYDISPGRSLVFNAPMSPDVSILPYEGRVVHLTNNNDFEMGAAGVQMPIYLLKWSVPIGHQPTLSPYWQGIGTFPFAGLVATGGFEVATTEYDSNKVYAVNNLLAAKADNDDQDFGGLLTNVDVDNTTALTPPWVAGGTTRTICGQVSKAPTTLRNGNTVLSLWTLYFPGDS